MQIFLGKQPFSIDAGSNIRTFAFQTGQIFSGAIQKLFPNDTARSRQAGVHLPRNSKCHLKPEKTTGFKRFWPTVKSG